MVDQFEGCEFWLPPEFLNDDDFHMDLKKQTENAEESKKLFDLFSGSSSESDEDEYVSGLSRKLDFASLEEKKACRLPGSPKSPLCKGAGEFSNRKMVQESIPGPNAGFRVNPAPQQQLQAVRHLQFEQMRRQQMMIQAQQNRGVKNVERMPPINLPVSAWPPLQTSQTKPQPGPGGPGMRAVFLGTNPGGAKKQCAGTGVFLPRTVSSTGNLKNKPGCSPVLIPDRVVQALNLNPESLVVRKQAQHQPGYYTNNDFPADYGAGLKYNNKKKKNISMGQRRQSIAKAEPVNEEVIRLLPEWTY